ncbi:MAG TPA: tetratricopeptide repeat protein [Chryseosolibacter sp.]|jgi:tetratricopeptide (TPR) repeat protein|nr:tetratricopeptide repeat protein [Chryseosolibacter sp.]
MLKTRLLLFAICAISIWLLFLLPKVVIENEGRLTGAAGRGADSVASNMPEHVQASPEIRRLINGVKNELGRSTEKEKNAIFADSLATLYRTANQFDSAGWFAERASEFFNTPDSWIKAADNYYQAFTLAINKETQQRFASKAQELYGKVLEREPENLEVKTKLAMTYISSASPMQGIMMLREVLEKDPQNELALFNMGMLSIQSGQYDRAVERLEKLVEINPGHVQGQLLLGVAFMNSGEKDKARAQFEKVKKLDKDPAVQATVDSYLEDLK